MEEGGLRATQPTLASASAAASGLPQYTTSLMRALTLSCFSALSSEGNLAALTKAAAASLWSTMYSTAFSPRES